MADRDQFCACGRRESECDGSRRGCRTCAHGIKLHRCVACRPASDRLTDGTAAWHFAEGRRAERQRVEVEGITAERIAALEAECDRLRRERDALRLACQALITDGTDLARLVERARSLLGAFDGGRGAEVDPALLAWARCVVAARGAVDGAE